MDSLRDDRRREFKETAFAMRAAQATQEGWEKVMDSLEEIDDSEYTESRIKTIERMEPKSNIDESEIEWLK